MLLRIFPPSDISPMVSGLLYSITKTRTAPARIRTPVMLSTSFVCSPRRFIIVLKEYFFLNFVLKPFRISNHTTYPRPPITMRNMVLIRRSVFPFQDMRLSGPIMSIPALQKAEIAVNTDIQIPCPTPYFGMNTIIYTSAPIPSTMNVPLKTPTRNERSPDIESRLKES